MSRKLTINYQETLSLDFIEEVLRKEFGSLTIERNTWGFHAPSISLREGYGRYSSSFLVYIKQKPKDGITVIRIKGSELLDSDRLDDIEDVIDNALREKLHIKYVY